MYFQIDPTQLSLAASINLCYCFLLYINHTKDRFDTSSTMKKDAGRILVGNGCSYKYGLLYININ